MIQEKLIEDPKIKPFEFQNWSVYEKALEVASAAHRLCREFPPESSASLRDQIRRASQSIPLNIAEGSSRFSPKDKANFFRMAKGSVFECVAVFDLAGRLGFVKTDLTSAYKDLETIGRMLSGLIKFVEKKKIPK